jgi:subtilisin family serine protease
MLISSLAPQTSPTPTATQGSEKELIVRFAAKPNLAALSAMPRGSARRQGVYDALVATAKQSQAAATAVLGQLMTSGAVETFESMYLPNAIIVKPQSGKSNAVRDALTGVAGVSAVIADKRFLNPDASAAARERVRHQLAQPAPAKWADNPAWGIDKIGASSAWSRANGTGITVGVVDTGLDAAHPAIAPHYRGTNANGTQSNDYNWFDPFDHSKTPIDPNMHGTHVAGTMAGGAAGGPQIGVAPGAKIIASRALDADGYNSSVGTLRALQWMLAPTKLDGTGADPTRGADVINNSWGNSDDRLDPTFRDTFDGLRAAGTVVVSAAGNDGMRGTGAPGNYAGFLSVAATNSRDGVTGFSSRGVPGSEQHPATMTPNVAAPGASIYSSVPGGRYARLDGTSMASPHVAGAVALLLSAAPRATEAQIIDALEKSAVDIDKPGLDVASGFGRIVVDAALKRLLAAQR